MQLSKFDHMKTIEIWEPRYHDDMVLLLMDKVKHSPEHIRVVFTKTKADKYKGDFYISKKKAMRYKKEYNGRAYCYAVPFADLENLEIIRNKQFEAW